MKRITLPAALLCAAQACVVETTLDGAAMPYGNTLPASSVTASGVTWSSNASEYQGRNGVIVRYDCPPNGAAGSIWGTDLYTDDTSVCTAGVHVGRIDLRGGGPVIIEILAGQSQYVGSRRYGVLSADYGSWGGSFRVL
ncbi:MAG: LCCL domain-containing protein [Polyangiales bacterium]